MTMINRYLIGNAQAIGRRAVQSSYFSTKFNEAGDLFAVLADGTIDHPNGRRAAILAVEYCVQAFRRNLFYKQTSQIMLETALQANRYVQNAVYTGKTPRLSLTMIFMAYLEAQYFNVGVNKIYIYNGQTERVLGGDSDNSYSCGKCILPAKSVIGMISAGAHTVTHPMERLSIIESDKNIFDKAQAMVESVKVKNLDNQMNATALLIEVL